MLIIKTTTPNYLRTILIIVSLMFSSFIFSQEICNNGLDDDGDGLIDLNDPDCTCTPATTTVPSLIPNPSFETMACCPSSYSQVNCASGWVQATSATSDYMNTCGFIMGAATNAGLVPFPDGNGIIGTIFSPGWQEYVGACLTAPMVAGTSYSIQVNIASTPIDGQGAVCNGGVIDFGPIDIVIFGAPNCSALPAATTDCPPAPWVPLGSVLYTPAPTWGTITITFTPSVNINTIMIGSPCTLPASYSPPSGCYPYFYYDNMLLNTSASFTTSIAQSGTWCSNNIQITGNSVAGATYQWYLEGVAIVGQTGLTLNVSALGLPAGNYSFVTTASGTCSVASTTVVASGGTNPNITSAGPFCSNAVPVNLVADIAGGTWSGTGITNTSAGTFDPTTATIGNNTITYTTGGTCPGTGTATIVVNALPTSYAGSDVIICTGNTASLGTTTSAGLSYAWNPTTGITSSTISDPTFNLTNATAAPTTTTYTVTTTNTATTCISTDQVDATVNPLATANAGPAQTICAGSSATLAGSIGGVATSGTWGGGSGAYNPNNSTLNAAYTPSATEEAAGSVTLTLISNDPAGPCPVASSTITISINPIAAINAGTDQTICIGSSVPLAGTIGGATTTGTWSGGAGIFTPNNTTATAVYTPTAAEEAANGLTLTFTSDDPAGPCNAVSDQMVITINQLPTTNAGVDQTICAGTSATLSGIIGGTASTAIWSGGTGTFTPDNTTLSASYLPSAAEAAAGIVTLTLTTNTPPGLCPAANDQMVITINPIATINAGQDQTICIGSTVTLAGAIGGATTTGTWSGGAGTFAPNNTTATAVYTPTAAEEAANGLTLTFTSDDPAGPCSFVSDQMGIIINQLPTANADTAQSVCKGSSIQLAGSIGGTATSGTWSGGTGTYVPSNNTLNAVYTPSAAEYAAGTVTLTLTTNDPAGPCVAVSSNVVFNFYFNPVVLFTVDDPDGCPVHCVRFTDTSTVGGGDNVVSWNWNFGDSSPDSTSQNPTHCYSLPGWYNVTLTTTSNHFCTTTNTITQMIHVFDVPVAEFNASPNPASVIQSTVTLINQSSSDVNYWNWQFGDGDSIKPNIVNPIHTYPNEYANTYVATLIVHNIDGCYDTVSHEIIIGPEFTFYIPNAFTPNGDGVNDFFFGTGIGITIYDIYIFDRWGNLIYHGDNIDTSKWDGKANHGSDVAQQDVYVWKVKITDVFNKKHNYIGSVTLVK